MSEQKNTILYDWLSFSSKVHNVEQVKRLLGLVDILYQNIYGFYGYNHRITYEGVSILYDGHSPEMGVMLDMSGQGCRTFETLGNGDWESLFALIKSGHEQKLMNISRLDVAYDDHKGILDIAKICRDTESGYYISRTRNFKVINSNKGKTIAHGSKSSSVFIRIYDKARERGHTDGRHWVRFEIQLRKGNALGFIRNEADIGRKFLGVVSHYLRYVVPIESDTNSRRWPDADYWQKFIQSAGAIQAISISEKPSAAYRLEQLETFVVRQAGNAIGAYITIRGVDGFLADIKGRGTRGNPKYEALVAALGKPFGK